MTEQTAEQIVAEAMVNAGAPLMHSRVEDAVVAALRTAGLLVSPPSEETIEFPSHWTKNDKLQDLHARYHCEAGNMLGRDECGWEHCEFWPAAECVFDALTAAGAAPQTESDCECHTNPIEHLQTAYDEIKAEYAEYREAVRRGVQHVRVVAAGCTLMTAPEVLDALSRIGTDRAGAAPQEVTRQTVMISARQTGKESAMVKRILALAEERGLDIQLAERSEGARLISAERERQITEEGYDADTDRGRTHALVDAAICYSKAGAYRPGQVPLGWPWADRYWKPSEDPRRNLVKAGALIAASIDALVEDARNIWALEGGA